MKLSFLKSIQKFAITELGRLIDSDDSLDALMIRNGMLSQETDEQDPFLDDDDDEEEEENACTNGIVPEYIDLHISRIPQYGDDSRWRIASHTDMFGDELDACGSLNNEQRQAVDNFAIGWSQANG